MKIIMPTFYEIEQNNQYYLDNNRYEGFHFRVNVIENFYLSIECRNESFIFPNNPNKLYFAWCNKAGFPIFSREYNYGEAAYLTGCADLLTFIETLQDYIKQFIENNSDNVKHWITDYNHKIK